MSSEGMAAPWPHQFAWAMSKGRGRGRGRPRPGQDDLERIAALRHVMGGRHSGGGPMFDPPFGGGRGRKRRGDVRVALLLLLAEEPRNGYQLMQTIEDRSGGRWRPSPGSVYPTLAQLEDEGLIQSTDREGAKLFEITDAGREHLDGRHDELAPWESEEDPEMVTDLKSEMKQLHAATAFVLHSGDPEQIARAAQLLAETRRSLFRLLAEETDA
jgi:DNA-binding PadR family transcriptional regulator